MRRDTFLALSRDLRSALDKRSEPPLLVVLYSPPEELEREGAYVGQESGIIFEGDEITVEEMISIAGGRAIATMQFRGHEEDFYQVPISKFRFTEREKLAEQAAKVTPFDSGMAQVPI